MIGLTGSIAMGKSTAAAMLRRMGLPVFDSDAAVHRLTAPGAPALADINRLVPAAVRPGPDGQLALDRKALGIAAFGDPRVLAALERILHPRVTALRRQWLAAQLRQRRSVVVADIPLLFETGADRDCTAVWVVSAPTFLQRQRALRRPGMTADKLAGALARQWADRDKRRAADVVVPTGIGHHVTLRRLRRALRLLAGRPTGATADHA
ncbi:MAG: dephospho-CoA kinase [Rhodospirillaceae bacterium]|nr:dephospho-CoA kinase [Rhodospirillaceae bacterium]